jgi:hypothetical protein
MNKYIGLPPVFRKLMSDLGIRSDKFDFIKFNTAPNATTSEIGTLIYNDTDGTLDLKISNDVTMQIGQEQLKRVLNKTGSTITNGSIVYINGSQGNRPTIAKTSINTQSTAKVDGVATEDILNNEYGFICTSGIVRGLNTKDLGEGTPIYASNNGAFTAVEPLDGLRRHVIGVVIKDHVNDGWILVDHDESIYMLGNLVNATYALFENTGYLKFVGTPIYDDLPPNPIIRSRTTGSNNPTPTVFVGTIQQYTFAVNDFVSDNLELIHTYREGTDLRVHMHFATNGVNTNDRYIKFEFEYTIANGLTAFPSAQTLSAEYLIPANTPDRTHYIVPLGTISGVGLKIGAVICYNIRRTASAGTAPTSNPFGLQVSSHHEVDSLGSRQLYIK